MYLEQRNKEQQESAVQKISQMKRKYETIIDKKSAENEEQKKEIDRLRKKIEELEKELEETRALLETLRQQKGKPLRYDDLYAGGILSSRVNAFTFFNTVEKNDAFLDLLNFADGTDG